MFTEQSMSDYSISVGIPLYNEEHNVLPLLKELLPILAPYDYEIIFVDDGSTDATAQIILQKAKNNTRIKLISFYRNFGHQTALKCAYQHATGDGIITMDADLQDPPDVIPSMISAWQDGADIVYAQRSGRTSDPLHKRITAHIFYKFINLLSDTKIPYDVGDFRLVDRKVATFLKSLPEHSPFLRGLVAWGGFPTKMIQFERGARHTGSTHYTYAKMINFALDGIVSFSTKPLRLASYAGFVTAAIGFIGIIYAILGRIFLPSYWVTGWTGLFVGIMFIGGVQLITIGIIGEYLKKIYHEVHRRPDYLIQQKVNI
jgi:dolichol-phosphate mannosyltransferase